MTAGIVTLTTSTFDETVAAADKPVIVDFWAEWCGPCKMIAPILSEIAAEQGDHLTIAKLNVDENPDIAMRFNVMSIPTLLVFNGGEVTKRLVGAKGKGQLLAGARRISAYFPLTPGQHGEAIRDLQRRLGAAGFPPAAGAEAAIFCPATEARRPRLPDRSWPALRRSLRRTDLDGAGRGLVEARRPAAVPDVAEPARRRRRRAAVPPRPARLRLRARRRHPRAHARRGPWRSSSPTAAPPPTACAAPTRCGR